jgi:hypothetical protein
MSRQGTLLIAMLAAVLAAPLSARAQGEERLSSLEDRITALEDQLRESQTVIKQQQEELKTRGPADVSQGAASKLDPFLQSVQIGGHVAASYIYNFNNPEFNNGTNTLCQFNCNNNEFSLDAAKLEIGKPASDPGTVGFQFDLLFGQNAQILGSLAPAGVGVDGNSTPNGISSDQELFVQQGFVSYNLNGTTFKLGKFETLLGYELLDSDANANVTQGLLFTFAIPLFHTGALASGTLGEGLTWDAGIVNGFNNSRDQGDNKAFLGKLGYTTGPFFASLATYIGTLGEQRLTSRGTTVGDNRRRTQIYDLIFQYQPTDSAKFWVNADIGRTEARDVSNDPMFFGVSVGYKQQLTEKVYLALRGEYMNDDEGSRFGPLGLASGAIQNPDSLDEIDAYSATVTLGYQIAPGLLARLEYRRDFVDCNKTDCSFFADSSGPIGDGGEETNDIGILELVYSFD